MHLLQKVSMYKPFLYSSTFDFLLSMKQTKQHAVWHTEEKNILCLQTRHFLVSTLLLLLVSNATSALCLIYSHFNKALHHSDI